MSRLAAFHMRGNETAIRFSLLSPVQELAELGDDLCVGVALKCLALLHLQKWKGKGRRKKDVSGLGRQMPTMDTYLAG
jgi:hypothetical protein